MDKTQEILGSISPYIKSMDYNDTNNEFILTLYNNVDNREIFSVVTFPKVTEYKKELHSAIEIDSLDDVVGIQKVENNSYIITTQSFEVFLKCGVPFS